MSDAIAIEGVRVGDGAPCFVVAEIGVNHNGDIDQARALVDAAAESGANAAKFQLFAADELASPGAPLAEYQEAGDSSASSQIEMLRSLALPLEEHAALKAHCEARGLIYLCTPYEESSLRALVELGVAGIKVASTDVTNLPFLEEIAATGLPILLSTGMATLGDVDDAVRAIESEDACEDLLLMQCTSAYPCPVEQLNLRAIGTLGAAFGCPVGFSDHSAGIDAASWAVAAGACLVEKHLTLSVDDRGPDHRASLEPHQFATLVAKIRQLEVAMGDGSKQLMPAEVANREVMQKGIVASQDLSCGEVLLSGALRVTRPAAGLPPSWLRSLVGLRLARDVARGEPITLESVAWSTRPDASDGQVSSRS